MNEESQGPIAIVPAKKLLYAMHLMLYRRHQNPTKCQLKNVEQCDECGTPHACPAVN